MCVSSRRRLQITKLILTGSVCRQGLRATELPRESPGYRDLPTISRQQTLSHGFPQYDCTLHSADANEYQSVGSTWKQIPAGIGRWRGILGQPSWSLSY